MCGSNPIIVFCFLNYNFNHFLFEDFRRDEIQLTKLTPLIGKSYFIPHIIFKSDFDFLEVSCFNCPCFLFENVVTCRPGVASAEECCHLPANPSSVIQVHRCKGKSKETNKKKQDIRP